MPYDIVVQDGEHCVIKQDTGQVVPGGCHATAEEAQAHIAALEIATEGEAANAITWEGPIAYEGQETGDGRAIEPGAIVWDDAEAPWPVKWVRSSGVDHEGGIVVGRMDAIERRGAEIWGRGVLLSAVPEVAELAMLIRDGAAGGVSIDIDDVEDNWEEVEGEEPVVATRLRIRGVTLVDTPAFNRATIALLAAAFARRRSIRLKTVRVPRRALVAAAAIGAVDLPLADREHAWDGAGAGGRVLDTCTSEAGTLDVACASRAFFYRDDPPENRTSYRLGFADVIDGRLKAVPKGIFAVAAVLAGGRGGVDLSQDVQDQIKGKVRAWYERMADEFDDPSIEAPFALVASGLPAPPAVWFANPGLDGPTALTVEENGRVFGHAALHGTCHTAKGGCVTVPRSQTDYAHFRVGAVLTADGTTVATGALTIATGHAGLQRTAADARAHYDHTGTAVADVVVGEDAYGVWVAGAVRPGATPEQIYALRASALSGDWRGVNGNLELVALLAVNVPGFPVPRASLAASGEIETLILPNDGGEWESVLNRLDRLERTAAHLRPVTAAAIRDRILAGRG